MASLEDAEIVRKVRKDLTEDELREVRDGLAILRTFKEFGTIGNWVKSVLIWIGIFLGAWFAFNEWVIKFIRGASQ